MRQQRAVTDVPAAALCKALRRGGWAGLPSLRLGQNGLLLLVEEDQCPRYAACWRAAGPYRERPVRRALRSRGVRTRATMTARS